MEDTPGTGITAAPRRGLSGRTIAELAVLAVLLCIAAALFSNKDLRIRANYKVKALIGPHIDAPAPKPGSPEDKFLLAIADAALQQTKSYVLYDPKYVKIPYPNGDVPPDRGVCADVVIRAYRSAAGIDLQKEVHEDMAANFGKYPKRWKLKAPDTNIDHRRVKNLEVFFTRKDAALPITMDPADFRPGDVVSWDLGLGVGHIGIVTNEKSADGQRPLVVHNIGAGPKLEDVLFSWSMTGHFRYLGAAPLKKQPEEKQPE